jgi:hypothetical protein
MEFLGKNWLPPISYKQFTNLIKGKNKYYKQMVALNGKEDPFRKTLIIIDEVHKIYSSSLSALEKPNPEVLQSMVQNSYNVSKENSLKLLLMTATPITDDHMSSIKIINLLLENYERFPEEFDRFKTMFCNENGLFTDKGGQEFMNRITGLVSYIDRANDRSQFAYPVIRDIILDVDKKQFNNMGIEEINKKIQEYEDRLNNKEVKLDKEEIKEIKKELNGMKKEKKNADKMKKEPRDVIDFINNCFTKKPAGKVKKGVNDNDNDEEDAKVAKAPKAPKAPKECPEGKVLNPNTGRCIKDKTGTVGAAKAPKAPKAPKAAKAPKADKKCPEGKVLNPKTGRCIKQKERDDKYSF